MLSLAALALVISGVETVVAHLTLLSMV